MPSRIRSKPLEETGPFKSIKKWANGVLADLVRTHIATVSGGGTITETAAGTGLVAGTGEGTKTLYFIEGGLLFQGDFNVKNIIEVIEE